MTNLTRARAECLVDGLYVHEWAGGAPTVLGLSGLGSSGIVWDHLAEALPGARVVSPDLRGRGRTAGSGEPGLRGHARDVARVAAALDLRDVVVVGHSMGAYLAPLVAQELGDRVQRLVLVDGGVPPKLPPLMRPGLTRVAFGSQLRRIDREWADAQTCVRKRFAKDVTPEIEPAVVRWLEYELQGEPGRLRPALDRPLVVADAVDTLHSRQVVPALESLTVPAHVVAAQHKHGRRGAPFLSDAVLADAERRFPTVTTQRVADTNHVTVVFAEAVREAVLAGA